jgi:hypothetical protein
VPTTRIAQALHRFISKQMTLHNPGKQVPMKRVRLRDLVENWFHLCGKIVEKMLH